MVYYIRIPHLYLITEFVCGRVVYTEESVGGMMDILFLLYFHPTGIIWKSVVDLVVWQWREWETHFR